MRCQSDKLVRFKWIIWATLKPWFPFIVQWPETERSGEPSSQSCMPAGILDINSLSLQTDCECPSKPDIDWPKWYHVQFSLFDDWMLVLFSLSPPHPPLNKLRRSVQNTYLCSFFHPRWCVCLTPSCKETLYFIWQLSLWLMLWNRIKKSWKENY